MTKNNRYASYEFKLKLLPLDWQARADEDMLSSRDDVNSFLQNARPIYQYDANRLGKKASLSTPSQNYCVT